MIATGDKFAVFPAPTDEAIVKPVDGKRIAAEKAHIASFDAFVFAVAFSACQFGQITAAQGGKPFFYPRAEHGQSRQITFVQNILRFILSQNHAGTLYQTAFAGNLQMIGDKKPYRRQSTQYNRFSPAPAHGCAIRRHESLYPAAMNA